MAPESTQPPIERVPGIFLGGKGQPAHRADNLTAIWSRLSTKCGSLDVSRPCGPPRSVTEIALPFYVSDQLGDVN
jgi:hypothetical protein